MNKPQAVLRVLMFVCLTCLSAPGQSVTPVEAGEQVATPVKLSVVVMDKNNRAVDDARQEDFRVKEDGVPQVITYFRQETAPAYIGLVLDNSGSLRHRMDEIIASGKYFFNQNSAGDALGDEAFVIRFIDSDKISILQDFTTSKARLNRALDNLYVEGGLSAVIDAVYESAKHLSEYKQSVTNVRRILVLITDGDDRSSFYKQDALFELLQSSDVQIFAIGLTSGLTGKGKERATGLLNRLARETGGRAFFPANRKELPGALDEILHSFHTRYVLGYSPTNTARGGAFRKVEVMLIDRPDRETRTAIARPGYLAPSASTEAQKK